MTALNVMDAILAALNETLLLSWELQHFAGKKYFFISGWIITALRCFVCVTITKTNTALNWNSPYPRIMTKSH